MRAMMPERKGAKHDRGQDEVPDRGAENIPLTVQCGVDSHHPSYAFRDAHACVEAARTRKPLESIKEEIESEKPQPEHGNRGADQRHEPREMIGPAILVDGRQDPQRHADDDGKQHRRNCQLDCAGNKLAQVVHHWAPRGYRFAQVTWSEIAHEIDVLKVNGLVKPIAPFRGGPNLRVPGGPLAEHRLDRIAGNSLSKDKRRNTDQEENQEQTGRSGDRCTSRFPMPATSRALRIERDGGHRSDSRRPVNWLAARRTDS